MIVKQLTYGSRGTLVYVFKELDAVPSELDGPLEDDSYHAVSGSCHEELLGRFSHNGPIYKHYNTPVSTNIDKW